MRNIGEIHNNNDMSLMVSASVCPKSHGPAIKRQLPSSIGESTTTHKKKRKLFRHPTGRWPSRGKVKNRSQFNPCFSDCYFFSISFHIFGRWIRPDRGTKKPFFFTKKGKKRGIKVNKIRALLYALVVDGCKKPKNSSVSEFPLAMSIKINPGVVKCHLQRTEMSI